MPKISVFPTLVREIFASPSLPREPEPDLVMEGAEQVAAYAYAGRIDGVMSAAYLFHSAKISQVFQGRKKVLDLGCGPATQLAQVAQLNPDIEFLGVDLSIEMLESAAEHIKTLGLANVTFQQADITDLSFLDDNSFDGVMSTMALHHLPTHDLLSRCFTEISRVKKPNGALYLVDFGRLKSLKSVIYFAYLNRDHQPHLFSLDYERSLRAAFTVDEFKCLALKCFGDSVSVNATFLINILAVIKTEERSLTERVKEDIRQLQQGLADQYKSDLNDMRTFFKLGGMSNDPF